MPQSKQMKGNRGNKTYMSFLRSSEKLRGSPVQPCDLMLGKVSTCPGNWPRLTHMHTVSVQSIILRECRWFYTLLAQSPAWPFFPISHLVFSKTFFMFLFSAILLSIVCFSIAQQHWGFWSFIFSPAFKTWSYTTSCMFPKFHAMVPPLQGDLGTDVKEPCLSSPCSDLF